MENDKVFTKKWDDKNKMEIKFIKGNGSLIRIEIEKGSDYEKEMRELSRVFSNKRLDDLMLLVLKDKGFKEEIN